MKIDQSLNFLANAIKALPENHELLDVRAKLSNLYREMEDISNKKIRKKNISNNFLKWQEDLKKGLLDMSKLPKNLNSALLWELERMARVEKLKLEKLKQPPEEDVETLLG